MHPENLEHEKAQKPLRAARSQAEVQAIKQRNIQIALTATNVLLSALTVFKVFGIL